MVFLRSQFRPKTTSQGFVSILSLRLIKALRFFRAQALRWKQFAMIGHGNVLLFSIVMGIWSRPKPCLSRISFESFSVWSMEIITTLTRRVFRKHGKKILAARLLTLSLHAVVYRTGWQSPVF